jgi:hypothetical protein
MDSWNLVDSRRHQIDQFGSCQAEPLSGLALRSRRGSRRHAARHPAELLRRRMSERRAVTAEAQILSHPTVFNGSSSGARIFARQARARLVFFLGASISWSVLRRTAEPGSGAFQAGHDLVYRDKSTDDYARGGAFLPPTTVATGKSR